MRVSTIVAAVGVAFAFSSSAHAQRGMGRGGTTVKDGEPCPAGMTEVRPRLCQPPEMTPPSIVDYRPNSTLKAPVHMVPKAKYPVIDFHGHPGGLLTTTKGLDSLKKAFDDLNLGAMMAADNLSGTRLVTSIDSVGKSPLKGRVFMLAGINFSNVGPGWAEKAIAQLEADVKAGAVGVGEIGKGLGLSTKKPDGSRLHIDDPELQPVWAACARLKLPVFIHTADPQEFFKQPDLTNERWLELSLFQDRRWYRDGYPSFETLATERNSLFRNNPKTTFVMAHLGWQANELGTLDKLFTELPNVYSEIGAVLYDIGRQPRGAHDFFVKFQDRILFGKDSFQPEEYPYYWRVFETNDDYFDYYRGYHAFWKLYGIGLPDEVLKKVYYKNALKITPLMPQSGWPK